ncbi:Rrf2 family transcriptional regulator [Paenibacillus sp. UASWS1643]|uniref:Rrf2 family transcriptional regulator n=1 Tax=Paenibacillus sp. UASWS1643 TaxID=2580422 RepID=UPI001238B9D5|nr:Rrf2 family transcriptional regulator [Paenibacillus sp. UASWS1643]KAA8745376.1 Rrf2 family transcriptional regulator [Paenibacillus sp. UASWS1643]
MQLLVQSGDLGPKWFHVAVRAIVILAQSDSIVKSNQIAETLGEDATSVRKILAQLTKTRIVQATGGRYGGYSLQISPDKITVKDIYTAMGEEPEVPYWSVPQTGTEMFISLIVTKAEEQFKAILNNYTITDILNNKTTK